MSRRLARARELLRGRLVRRGVTLGQVLVNRQLEDVLAERATYLSVIDEVIDAVGTRVLREIAT